MTCITSDDIFAVTPQTFEELALKVFRFQFDQNKAYSKYCSLIRCKPESVKSIYNIPFFPVHFFKTYKVVCGTSDSAIIFESSGTTGLQNSKHFVKQISMYQQSFLNTFERYYGDVKNYCVLGLLPSYLERTSSSLVYMVDELIKLSRHPASGFYLNDHEKLYCTLSEQESKKQKVLLIGVTYALLDYAKGYPMKLKHTIVLETGGMKGRQKELTREEVHRKLQQGFGIREVHSEYGMTELLTQAYSLRSGFFSTPPWMNMFVRAEDDPYEIALHTKEAPVTGLANIIDLANLYSCSFIATDDIIRLHSDNNFEVIGRRDNSDMRGCGLMIQ